jgi:signal peptidase II
VSAAVSERSSARARRELARALVRASVLAAVVIGVDQLTKALVRADISVGDQRPVLPFVNLVHVRNNGVAFNLLSGGGPLVLAFTFAALAVLLVFFLRRPGRQGLWVATGLLVGGALGNLVDRLAHGAVTDFIKLPAWPAFNVADISITFGVLTLLWVLEGPRARRGRD